VNDSFGDGICCAYGDGSYTLEVAGTTVATGGDFGSTETTSFCTGDDIPGCTDAAACNYNPSATLDDGSCTYPPADNLDCDGNCLNDADNDGICDEDEQAESSFVQLGYDVVGQNTVAGMTTYRVWVELADPTEQLVAVYGFDSVPLTINTTTAFYQNPLGGALAVDYNPAVLPVDPLLEFDSWLTVGGQLRGREHDWIGLRGLRKRRWGHRGGRRQRRIGVHLPRPRAHGLPGCGRPRPHRAADHGRRGEPHGEPADPDGGWREPADPPAEPHLPGGL
ncbi:MAG: hypothetical protein ACPG85_02615, partial [Flavobacteriales bacterium]